jgi:type I restriction enzyme, S subunit
MTPEGLPPAWRPMRYGDALSETDERCGLRTNLPVLSVTKSRGPMLASERFGRALHGRDLAKYRVAPAGHIVADPMLLWDGSIGIQRSVPEGLVSPDYRVYRPTEIVDPDFMAFVVRDPSRLPFYKGAARGTNVRRNRIARGDFLAIPLPVPPLPEQRKIAAILSSIDDAIEATQAVIDQLQVVKKAMMAELLTRGLPGRHTRFKQTEIGEVPEGWTTVQLGDVANIFNGRAAGTGGTWLRVFKTKHVYDGLIKLSHVEYCRDESAAKVPEETYLCDGDTLTPNMAHGTIGRVAFVPRVEGRWTIDGQVMVVRTMDASRVLPRFIYESLSTKQGKRQLLDREKGGAFGELRGQTHLYPRDARTIVISLPPLEEQKLIAAALSSFDEPIATNLTELQAVQILKQGLVSVLLTGEVRVTPDEATP